MRSLLASLALLLLALCSTTADVTFAKFNSWSSVVLSKINPSYAKTLAALQLAAGGADEMQVQQLLDEMGNTFVLILMSASEKYDETADYQLAAFEHGVLCDVSPALEDKIKAILYGGGNSTDDRKSKEKEAAKNLEKMAIDCGGATADPCLCAAGQEKPLLYCLAEKLRKRIAGASGKKAEAGSCMKEALQSLKAAGKGGLWKMVTGQIMPPADSTFTDVMAAMTMNYSPDNANFYCDVTDSALEEKAQKVYASDGLFWTADVIQMRLVAPPYIGSLTLDKACAKREVKSSSIGKCICSPKKKAFTYCSARTMGTIFKNTKFLDCASTPAKFDPSKTEETLSDVEKFSEDGNTPSDRKTSGSSNKDKTGSAAASLLPVAPLAAAAALLLLLLLRQ